MYSPKAKRNICFSFFVSAHSISGRHTPNSRGYWWGEATGEGGGAKREETRDFLLYGPLDSVNFEGSEFISSKNDI